ncbi:MAG: hypothetical protein LW817_07020, partial [Candidatus Caenarcaniphilales bacterium]|nr:hypothetical protein [Candidatus Caenarcaniphilales bacterium]
MNVTATSTNIYTTALTGMLDAVAAKKAAQKTSTAASTQANSISPAQSTPAEITPLEKLSDFINGLNDDQKETFCQKIIEADVSKAEKDSDVSTIMDLINNDIEKITPEWYANIKQYCQEQGAILGAITQHGNIVNAYANLPDAFREVLSKGLGALSPKQDAEIGTEAYQQELITFKESLAKAINTYNLCIQQFPKMQKQTQNTLIASCNKILEEAEAKFRKEDIDSLLKDLKETTAKTDKDP